MITCSKKQSGSRLLLSSLVLLTTSILSGCNPDDGSPGNPNPTPIPTAVPTTIPTAVPTVTPTAVPTATPTATPTQNPGTSINRPPSARITAPQSAVSGQTVTLDGSGSFDPEGDLLSYQWTQTEGPDIALSNSTSQTLSFVAPSVAQATAFSFQLSVHDGELSSTAGVVVQISPTVDDKWPSIVSRSPQPNQSGVSTTTQIRVDFDEALLESSVNNQSLLLSQNGTPVTGVVSYDRASNSITNKPTTALSPGVSYTVTVASNLTDLAGNAFAGESWNFSTDSSNASAPVCDTVAEGKSLTLSCPSGQVINEVTFASYGTPDGSCGSFTSGSCNASNSQSVVSDACKGKSNCTVKASNDSFGDPCGGTLKKLAAQVACGMATDPTPTPTPTQIPTQVPTQSPNPGTGGSEVGLYRLFELPVQNNNSYSNKFTDVELRVTYTAPSGRGVDFWGFFDGNGQGGGDKGSGNVWKLRFMPDELGVWTYQYSWSDGSPGGSGSFNSVATNAGKGILRAYKDNPRWFAYNGTDPVWLKSYYETGHGAIAQPFDWIKKNVYQPMLDRGYNHLQVNWLLPLCCDHQYYHDGPDKSIDSIRLYQEGKASSTMQFNVWHMMEEHVRWLNDRDVGLHMFLGFNGGRNDGPDWKKLSDSEKEFFVRYVVARLGPFANIAGWNYVWEPNGNDASGELGLARLLQQHDIFQHLRTYEDQFPDSNEYKRPEYTFAAVENHGVSDKNQWGEAWTHHKTSLLGYVSGKPVYMSEGNALWRRFWFERINAKYGGVDQNDLRQSAWACATAGASFNWNGHAGEDSLVAFGDAGLPFVDSGHPFAGSARAIDILSDTMNNDVEFYRMTPHDDLLSSSDDKRVWSLAEEGRQYLVFATGGDTFKLKLSAGQYSNNKWIDAKTGSAQAIDAITISGGETRSFSPPNKGTDWVLVLHQ